MSCDASPVTITITITTSMSSEAQTQSCHHPAPPDTMGNGEAYVSKGSLMTLVLLQQGEGDGSNTGFREQSIVQYKKRICFH